jgi:KRAB domain-containing zinc finger protein
VLLHRLLDCEQCDQVFTSVTELDLHRNLAHQSTHQREQAKDSGPRKRKYECTKCNHMFVHHEYLKRHIKYFHGANPMCKTFVNNQGIKVFKCLVCQHGLISFSDLMVHISSKHTNSRPFKCEVCLKSFLTIGKLNQHKQVHSGHIWRCDICSEKFTNKFYLKQHTLKVHSQSVECKICGKNYKSGIYLLKHMRYLHATETPFECNLCGKAFSQKHLLNSHCKQVHNNLELFCKGCNINFSSKGDLARHIRYKHSKNPLVFSCNKCPAKFGTQHSYNHHMQQVHATGCFKCEMCGAKFKCQAYFNCHMRRVHTGLVLHCAHCKYATRRKYVLRRHINKYHTGKS